MTKIAVSKSERPFGLIFTSLYGKQIAVAISTNFIDPTKRINDVIAEIGKDGRHVDEIWFDFFVSNQAEHLRFARITYTDGKVREIGKTYEKCRFAAGTVKADTFEYEKVPKGNYLRVICDEWLREYKADVDWKGVSLVRKALLFAGLNI